MDCSQSACGLCAGHFICSSLFCILKCGVWALSVCLSHYRCLYETWLRTGEKVLVK